MHLFGHSYRTNSCYACALTHVSIGLSTYVHLCAWMYVGPPPRFSTRPSGLAAAEAVDYGEPGACCAALPELCGRQRRPALRGRACADEASWLHALLCRLMSISGSDGCVMGVVYCRSVLLLDSYLHVVVRCCASTYVCASGRLVRYHISTNVASRSSQV